MSDLQHAQQVCIAACLADPNLHLDLVPDDFPDARLNVVWRAMERVGRDLVPLSDHLAHETGESWLTELLEISDVPSLANAVIYADAMRTATAKRRASSIAARLLTELSQGGGLDCVTRAARDLASVEQAKSERGTTIADAAQEAVDLCRSGVHAIPTGIGGIDRGTGGFHDGDLIIAAARTGIGKTALMNQFALAASKAGHPVGVISGEQCARQLGLRAIAQESTVSVAQIRNHTADWREVDETLDRLRELKFYINDTAGPSLAQVQSIARAWQREHGIKALYVDYLQRMATRTDVKPNYAIGQNAMGLKSLAVELSIPVICLAQLNRDADGSDPRLSQLKDSGSIEQEADQVYLLHAPEPDYNAAMYEVHLSLAKNRHGPVMFFPMMWHRSSMTFKEMK